MTDCTNIHTFTIRSQPDCIKSFPFSNSPEFDLSGSILVSCYRFDETSKHREGCLVCFNPSSFLESKLNRQSSSPREPKFTYFATDVGGILSFSWTKFPKAYGVSFVSSTLKVLQYSISPPSHPSSDYHFTKLNEVNLPPKSPSSVALSLSTSDDSASSICVTSSDGTAYLIRDSQFSQKWNAHNLETWTSSFHPDNSNLILTGSDDSNVRVFDLRSPPDSFSSLNCHTSGVTTIQFLPNSSHYFFTGGFDNLLVKHDFRSFGNPLEVIKTSTPVWFLDFVTDSSGSLDLIHISGCHDGSSIYNSSCSLVSSYRPPDCLIYGTSHLRLSSTVFCCCDFYSRSLHFYS